MQNSVAIAILIGALGVGLSGVSLYKINQQKDVWNDNVVTIDMEKVYAKGLENLRQKFNILSPEQIESLFRDYQNNIVKQLETISREKNIIIVNKNNIIGLKKDVTDEFILHAFSK